MKLILHVVEPHPWAPSRGLRVEQKRTDIGNQQTRLTSGFVLEVYVHEGRLLRNLFIRR